MRIKRRNVYTDMTAIGTNDSDDEGTNDNSDHYDTPWLKKEKCTFCQEIREINEVEVYYNQGRNKRIIFLCCTDMLRKNADPCYDRYMDDLGIARHLIVAGHNGTYDRAYNTILSFFISSPCPYSTLWTNSDIDIKKKMISWGIGNLALEDAVQIAYKISPITRQYLEAVDLHKLPNHDPTNLNNPRLHPIIWSMLYNDKLLVTVDKDKLIFKWSQIMI
jgi:hypothetical protein